jgi:hypothetical protein
LSSLQQIRFQRELLYIIILIENAIPAEVAQVHKSLLGCQDLQQSPTLGQVFHLLLSTPFPANLSSVLPIPINQHKKLNHKQQATESK